MTNSNKHYDVIVVGSGIGGSTAAILLSKFFNKKVLVVEQHWKFGGLTHEFEIDGKSFASGLHYIGGVNDNGMPDKLFDVLTAGKIRWLSMPFRYDEIIFPDFSYAFPASEKTLTEDLHRMFPEEKRSINKFMRQSKKAYLYLGIYNSIRSFAPKIMQGIIPITRLLFGFNPNITLQKYLDKTFQNEQLKRLLAAQWCDYGIPPREASLMIHATIFHHYMNGAYYPKGGPREIAQSMADCLKNYGATILLNSKVTEILIEHNRASGVRVHPRGGTEETYTADYIISNVGAHATYKYLLSDHHFSFLEEDEPFLSARYNFFTIYVSLDESPEKLGFDGSNKWIFKVKDHNKAILHPEHPDFPGFYCLLFPSLKARDKTDHTMEVLTLLDYNIFEKWEDQKWQKRDADYYALKDKIARSILEDMEKRYPGIKGMIHTYDTSSPLTIEQFVGREKGSGYGVPYTTKRMKMKWLSTNTPFKNLFLSGQDAMGPGIMGAMFGGVGAAARIIGSKGYPTIMKKLNAHKIQNKSSEQ